MKKPYDNMTARQKIAYTHPLTPTAKEPKDMVQSRRLSAFYNMWSRLVLLDFDTCKRPYWVAHVWFTEKDDPTQALALQDVPVPFLVELHDEGQSLLAGVGSDSVIPKMTHTGFFFRRPLSQEELYDLPLAPEVDGEFA